MKPEDRNSLIEYRIEQAYETVSDVELLIKNDRLRSAVNRIYYGMFYALSALALKYRYETSKHAQLIGWFNKNFVKEGIVSPEFGKMITKAYNRRTKGDYDFYMEFDKDLVEDMFDKMKRFINEIRKHL